VLYMCNRFHARRANSGKMTTFYGGTLVWRPRSRGIPSPSGTKICHKKNYPCVAHSADFMILSCVVLTQCSSVTDRRTDGRTDWLTPLP